MAVRIVTRMSADQVQYLDIVVLRHTLYDMIKLSLTNSHTLQTELRFGLNQPRLDIVRPERRKLDGKGV